MKKLLLLGLFLALLAPNLGAVEEGQKKLRLALRTGDISAFSGGVKDPPTKDNPALLYGGSWEENDVLYGVWKIRGPERFQKKLIWYLQVLEKEHPVFYKVAQRKVKMFRWLEGKSTSWAYLPHGNIGLAQRAFERTNGTHRVGAFFVILIHEIQHCNAYGDHSEGAAVYAMHHYGSRTKAVVPAGYLIRYYRALSLKKGYTEAIWNKRNLTPTRNAILN